MKSDWQIKKLGELYEITSSKRVFKAEWKDVGVPFYRAREIVKLAQNGFVKNKLYISDEMYNKYVTKYGVPKADDIMVTGVGTLGICYVVKEGDKFYFKDGNIIWLKKQSDINSKYVEYAFKSDLLRKQIDDSVGATVGTFTIIKAKNTLIPVPSVTEQQRIVKILNEVFEKTKKAEDNIKRGLITSDDLFNTSLQHAFDMGNKTTIKFNQVCEINSKLVDPKQKMFQEMLHVGGANIETKSGKLINLKTAKEEKLISGKFVFDDSMILYSKIRPYLMKVARPNFKGLCSADIYPLSPKQDKIDRNYLFYLLLTPNFTEYAIKGSGRAGMPKVNRDHLFNFDTYLPSVKEQRLIANKLDNLSTSMANLKDIYHQKLKSLGELKKSILNKAFSGEL